MKKNLILEIRRIKEMMGVSHLNEGYDDLFKKMFKMSDESASSIGKNADESTSSLSLSLKNIIGGNGSYDDLLSFASKEVGAKTTDEVVSFIKNNPKLLKIIVSNSDILMRKAAREIINTVDLTRLISQDSLDEINNLLSFTVREENVDVLSSEIEKVIKILRNSGYEDNPNIKNLIKKLEERSSVINTLKDTDNLGTELPELSIPEDILDKFFPQDEISEEAKKFWEKVFAKNTLSYFDINGVGDIDWSKIDGFNNLFDYNREISKALETNNFDKLSEGGFEKIGIKDFKGFIRDRVNNVTETNSDMGTWEIKMT